MTVIPSNNFDIMDFLIKEKTEIRQRLGFNCELEVELGSEWVYLIESRFDSWSSHYPNEISTILGMALRINYQNPNEIKIWANIIN